MKKQRTFTQRWNATALRRILKQFNSHEEAHLCSVSPEFKSLWADHKQEIKALASKYTFENCEVSPGFSDCLIYPTDSISYTDWLTIRKQVRIDFLTNEIKRLTTK